MHTRFVLVRDLGQAAQVVDDIAPEHLLLLIADPHDFLPTVRNAGAIFLGPWSAVPFGDYGVASNHVLPTAGTARFGSGLRAADFVTVRSVVEMTAEAAARSASETSVIARSEGLVGHAAAMDARKDRA
jgi:histidinol dehydrogenase